MALWKVYNADTGRVMKAGFDDEDGAKEWAEARFGLEVDQFIIEEMDPDEEEEYLEALAEAEKDEDEEDEVATEEDTDEDDTAEDAADDFAYGDDDDYLDPDDGILGEVGEDEEDNE